MPAREFLAARRLLKAGWLFACVLCTLNCGENVERRIARITAVQAGDGEASIRLLENAAKDPQPAVRALAVATLGRIAPERAAGIALTALDDEVPAVRAAAARTLGGVGDPSAEAALASVVRRDASWEVRRRAAEALGALGEENAAEALRLALLDSEPEVRIAAARALGRVDPVGSVRTCEFVMQLDDAWQVRWEAAQVLALAKTDEARTALRAAAASDPNEFVRAVSSRGAGA